MAWSNLTTEQMVSFTDAQSGGFTLNVGQSHVTSNQCMTKNSALEKYNLSASNMDLYGSLQLVPKSAWVTGISNWSASLITFNTSKDITSIGVDFTTGGYVYVSPDGTRLYISSYAGQTISQYSLSIPNNINSTITYIGISPSLGIYFTGIQFSPDGTKVCVTQISGFIKQYTLSTPWTISSMSTTVISSITFPANNYVRKCSFNRDGTKIFGMYGTGNYTVNNSILWTLATPYNLSSVSSLVTSDITETMPTITATLYLEKITSYYYCFTGNNTNFLAAYNNGITNTDLDSYLPGSVGVSIYAGPECSNDVHIYNISRSVNLPYIYTLNQYLTNL